jgi:hypothetical protein
MEEAERVRADSGVTTCSTPCAEPINLASVVLESQGCTGSGEPSVGVSLCSTGVPGALRDVDANGWRLRELFDRPLLSDVEDMIDRDGRAAAAMAVGASRQGWRSRRPGVGDETGHGIRTQRHGGVVTVT